jgi:two-component sensor histidine kinase
MRLLPGSHDCFARLHARQAEQRWRAALTHEVEARTTELRDSKTRSKLLAAELDHRAKNMLALVQLLLRQTHADTVQAYARAAQGRVSALARARCVLRTKLLLEPRTAQALAMVLHDPAPTPRSTAPLSMREGQVCVDWRIDPDSALRLTWSESGGPRARGSARR